jgi:hypothetical protein
MSNCSVQHLLDASDPILRVVEQTGHSVPVDLNTQFVPSVGTEAQFALFDLQGDSSGDWSEWFESFRFEPLDVFDGFVTHVTHPVGDVTVCCCDQQQVT